MADAQNIEDVLSSIRRLVSDEVATQAFSASADIPEHDPLAERAVPMTLAPSPPPRGDGEALILLPVHRVREPEDPYRTIGALAEAEQEAREQALVLGDAPEDALAEDVRVRPWETGAVDAAPAWDAAPSGPPTDDGDEAPRPAAIDPVSVAVDGDDAVEDGLGVTATFDPYDSGTATPADEALDQAATALAALPMTRRRREAATRDVAEEAVVPMPLATSADEGLDDDADGWDDVDGWDAAPGDGPEDGPDGGADAADDWAEAPSATMDDGPADALPVEAGFHDEDILIDGIPARGDAVLDPEMLREVIADVVREELAGPLGERITRNVRKLVRRELRVMFSDEEFD